MERFDAHEDYYGAAQYDKVICELVYPHYRKTIEVDLSGKRATSGKNP